LSNEEWRRRRRRRQTRIRVRVRSTGSAAQLSSAGGTRARSGDFYSSFTFRGGGTFPPTKAAL